jgi:TDG/mug DNA glycosylase family protein
MDEDVETLEDLLRPGLRAVCVGINPTPVSVAAGHYYQGDAGQRFLGRLRRAGVLSASSRGHEDDAAFAVGIGFTDIIKRPAKSAKELRSDEYEHGRPLLAAKLEAFRPEFVIFTFKETAKKLYGRFDGNGFMPDLQLADSEVFVMPGPYEDKHTAAATMRTLAARFQRS